MNEEWKNETPEKKIERLELVKDRLVYEVKMLTEALQREKEKNKKLEEELNKFMSGEVFSANQAKYMEKQNKIFQDVIDMMAEDFVIYTESCPEDLFDVDMNCDNCKDNYKECIREYYFNKVKEKANE